MAQFLIIGGHQRSGTTLLRHLCHSHPEMTVSNEFGCWGNLGWFYGRSVFWTLRRAWRKRNWAYLATHKQPLQTTLSQNYSLAIRYVFELSKQRQARLDSKTIKTAFYRCLPANRIIGDKSAFYVFSLDELAATDNLARVIIYRDCRDVASSTLTKARAEWRNKPFVKTLNTAEKVARRWVRAIELMERHADQVYVLRYEDLIRKPEQELGRLALHLGISPHGFQLHTVHTNSVSKYKQGLSREELATVMRVAGPTMSRLGYG